MTYMYVALESFKGHKGMFGSLNGKEIKGWSQPDEICIEVAYLGIWIIS